MSTTDEDNEKPDLGPDEVYCTSCGVAIKQEAEICPECGVRQVDAETSGDSELPETRKYELQKIARKSKLTTAVVGFLISPVAYVLLGKTGLALINFFTLNYALLGFIIVPIHAWKIIGDAQDELERHGETW